MSELLDRGVLAVVVPDEEQRAISVSVCGKRVTFPRKEFSFSCYSAHNLLHFNAARPLGFILFIGIYMLCLSVTQGYGDHSPPRLPRPSNGEGEAIWMLPLLRAEGGEEEPQVGLVAPDDGRPTAEV